MFGFGGRGPKHPPEIVNQKELDVIRENSNKRSRSVHRDLNKIQNWKALHEQRGVPEDDSFKYVQDQIFKERNLYNDIRPYEDENEKGTQTDVADEEQNASSSSPLDFIKIENILLSNFLDECLTQLVQSLEKIPHLDYPNLVPYKAKVIKFIFKLQEKLDQKCAN